MQSNSAPSSDPSSAPPPPPSQSSRSQAPATIALHADQHLNTSADVAPPLHVSTTFTYTSDPTALVPASAGELISSETNPHVYSRETAPNSTRLETLLTSLLGAPTLAYSSGIGALFALYTLLNPKKVAITGGYHGSHGILGIFKRLTKVEQVTLDEASTLSTGDVIHVETPLNPLGTARNLTHYAAIAKQTGAILLVDATLAPPPLQDPFRQGADVVMHSGTKYIGGHSDMLLGTLSTRNEACLKQLAQDRTFLGNITGSLESWLGVRSMRTMGLRVERQSANATRLVEWLDAALRGQDVPGKEAVGKVVERVWHASLQARDEPDDAGWIREQMPGGWGPLFAFTVKTEELARRLPGKLENFMHATSLGGVESLIEWRAMSDASCDQRLLRVSVGVEGWEDLRDDLVKGMEGLVKEMGL